MKIIIPKKISLLAGSILVLATMATPAFAQNNNIQNVQSNITQNYRVTLSPLNNSGVYGFASITQNGNQYTVNMTARGLEPNQIHVQHIHGMVDGSNSSCPTMVQNKDNDSTISLAEGLPVYGPILQSLTPFQTTGSNGKQMYQQSFSVNTMDPTMDVLPLANREIVIHGRTVFANEDLDNPSAGYDATLPVACGHIIPLFNNGGGSNNDNGSGNNQTNSGGSSIIISGNGAGSHNSVDVHSTNSNSFSQEISNRITNDISSRLETGNNRANSNTGGDIHISSGDERNSISISNMGGMNMSHR